MGFLMIIKQKFNLRVSPLLTKNSKIKNQFSKIRMSATFGKEGNLKLNKELMVRKMGLSMEHPQ